jgi:signal transduction histidine kinase
MTPEILNRKLGSVDPRDRLDAARYLAENAKESHLGQIEAALGVETVAWVRSALRRAFQKVCPDAHEKKATDAAELTAEHTAQIYSNALETTAAQIIHEIEPIMGSLRLSAESEMPKYEGSDTQRGLDRLDELVAGLSRLRRAASAPKVEELALDRCIYDWIAEEEASAEPIRVLRAGPQDCVVEGDKSLICLSFVNGLRNAIDATKSLEVEDDKLPDVTVNWGTTDVDSWISIVDNGIGFRGNIARAFDFGSTNKEGHLGMGLATAQQAMTSMDGSVRLVPSERGVRFEMRWPKAGV